MLAVDATASLALVARIAPRPLLVQETARTLEIASVHGANAGTDSQVQTVQLPSLVSMAAVEEVNAGMAVAFAILDLLVMIARLLIDVEMTATVMVSVFMEHATAPQDGMVAYAR